MSGAARRYPQPVAVWVFEVTLPPGETLLVNGNGELLGNAVDVDCADLFTIAQDGGLSAQAADCLRLARCHLPLPERTIIVHFPQLQQNKNVGFYLQVTAVLV